MFALVYIVFKRNPIKTYKNKKFIILISIIALVLISIFIISISTHARKITLISLISLMLYTMFLFILRIVKMIMFSKSIFYKILSILVLIFIISSYILMISLLIL